MIQLPILTAEDLPKLLELPNSVVSAELCMLLLYYLQVVHCIMLLVHIASYMLPSLFHFIVRF